MWATTSDREVTPSQFAVRRIERIVPLYWTVTMVVLCISLAMPSLTKGGINVGHALGSFFFIPVPDPVTGGETDHIQPIIPQGWTLNYEMAFYAIFTTLLFLKSRQLRLLAVIAILAATASLSLLQMDSKTVLGFYSNDIVFEFAFGVILGALWKSQQWREHSVGLPSLVFVSIALVASVVILDSYSVRLFRWGVPAGLAVLLALMLERYTVVRRSPTLLLLGDASYSIYLTHGITLTAVAVIWKKLHLVEGEYRYLGFVILGSLMAALMGVCCYLSFERPLNRRLNGRRESRVSARQLAVDVKS